MTLGGNKLAVKYLDPDLCFASWIVAGSASRARERLAHDGITHPVTGESPSKMGITYAAKESAYYRAFLQTRVEHPEISATPTKAEYEAALKLYKERIGEQKEIVRGLHEQYASIDYVRE